MARSYRSLRVVVFSCACELVQVQAITDISGPFQANGDEFRSGRVAPLAMAFQGYQRVGLRVIGCRLARWCVVGQQGHAGDAALDAVVPEGNHIDFLSGLVTQSPDVLRVDEDYLAHAPHAPVTVLQAIDG